MIQYGGMGCGTKGLVKGLRKFGWDSPAPDKWSTTNTIQRHKEVWAGPRAAAGVLIKSNSYIKWSTVGRQNTAETWRSNWSTLIWYKIMEPQIVSECLRFCIAELSLLLLPPETSWAVLVTEFFRPSHPPGSSILRFIYPDHSLVRTARWAYAE